MTATIFYLLAAVLAATTGTLVAGAGDDGTTHIRLYIHETFSGANATAVHVTDSPLGGNSTYGTLSVFDDELRQGSDAASQLVGRAQGITMQADLQDSGVFSTLLTVVFTVRVVIMVLSFTDGGYKGSTLVLSGRVDFGPDGKAAAERAVVGGTGRFRLARGYSLMSKFGTTSSTAVLKLDLYVKTDV
ncbi:dirigent protein 1 [Aegilops tauschii subsp. strangulata]|uniref:dirigent protein 1 n=1 Tax=Aegilops tauschii subsp. strangulata TaxID=200361 RepID=UPI003CC8C8C1